MPRWKPDARARLEEAALTLYAKNGYDETTIDEIAAHARLTKRTFFRYFADKREVLFGGGDNVQRVFVAAIQAAPASARALDAVAQGLDALAAALDEQGEEAARRFRIVRASPELWERQLIKFTWLANAGSDALRARGVGETAATLASEAGIAALRVASDIWIRRATKQSLRQLVAGALADLRAVASPVRVGRARGRRSRAGEA